MNLHNLKVYNKPLFYIGAILGFTGTYLDNTKTSVNLYLIWASLVLGLVFMLISFRKPRENKIEE